MTRPRLLDLFCGAGGAAVGYDRAGFEVIGVDIKPQPNYPFEFVKYDVIDFMDDFEVALGYDAVHASPPCQRWLGVPRALGDRRYPDLIGVTRDFLLRTGLPWVIENVPTAPLEGFVLCGSTFGLPIVRHRLFETSVPMLAPSLCPQRSWQRGTAHAGTYPYAHGAWRPAWRERVMPVVWPWMTLEETGEAIPPAYTEWIGRELIAELERAA